MTRSIQACLWAFLATIPVNAIAADKFILKVTTDRKDALYETGQPAAFHIALEKNGKPVDSAEVDYVLDDFITDGNSSAKFPSGRIKINNGKSQPIPFTSNLAGFVRCRATFRGPNKVVVQSVAGAGFGAEKIQPSLPVPDDFDAFWNRQKEKLATIPLELKLTPVAYKDSSLECFDAQMPCLGGAPVSGYFARPKGAKNKSLPAVLWVHGAGVRSSSLANAITGAKAGMLSMDINAHGIPNGKPGKFYQDLNRGRLNNYRFAGRKTAETSYFRGMYLRLVRAIDFLTAQPEWDGKVVAVIGHSQGGGQALVAGGIDSRVTFVATGVPAICDHSGRAAGRINGWPKLVPTNENGKPDAEILQASRYVDAVNFASRCKADAVMSVGFIDAVCPPSSCYAAYNQLKGAKRMINEPLMGHAAPSHIRSAFFTAIQDHVKQSHQASSQKTTGQLHLPADIHKKCLATLRAGMRSSEFWPSIHAAEALTLAGGGDEVRKYLEPKLSQEADDQKRCGIARELVRAGDWRKSEVMLKILAGKDPHGHVHAAESLFKVAEIGDGEAMRKAAKSAEPKLRLMASAALARCGSLAALASLRDDLASPDADTRRIAAWILARIGDKSDVPQIRRNLAKTKDAFARCYQQHALAALGDDQGEHALLQNLHSGDPAVRTYAATFAGDARILAAQDLLTQMLADKTLDVRVRAAQSLLVMSKPIKQSPRDISNLVYPATKENPRYTEGSVVRLDDGQLLYAVTQFIGNGSDFANARIVGRQSSDGGVTWSAPRVLQKSTGKMNVMSATLRRIRTKQGAAIALFYLQKNSYNDLHAFMRLSKDNARTFGEAIQVTGEPGYHVMNNDRITQLKSGRILAPVASTPDVHKVNHFVSYCWLSDDFGATWRKSTGVVDLPKRGAMEPEVVELEDNRVMMIMRNQLGHISVSYSKDGGDHWSKPSKLSTLKAPEAPATLRRIPATGDLLLIWNNNFQAGSGHGGKRTPLTAAISSDNGDSWRHVRDLESNTARSYSYTSVAFARGRVLLTYWEGEKGRLSSRFRSLPVTWFYGK